MCINGTTYILLKPGLQILRLNTTLRECYSSFSW